MFSPLGFGPRGGSGERWVGLLMNFVSMLLAIPTAYVARAPASGVTWG